MLTPVDKILKKYKLIEDKYNHLLDNAVTTTYKKATQEIEECLNKEDIKYAKRAVKFDRIEINGTSNRFITLKDR